MRKLFIFVCSAILFSCSGNSESADNDPNLDTDTLVYEQTQNDLFRDFVSEFTSSDSIPVEFHEPFLRPALADIYYFHYNPSFEYSFGQIYYEDENIVALAFETEGDDGYNMLSATIMASYDNQSGECINSMILEEFSTYEGANNKGYNSDVEQRIDEIATFDQGEDVMTVSFEINTTEFYFSDEIGGGITEKEIPTSTFKFVMDKEGYFYPCDECDEYGELDK